MGTPTKIAPWIAPARQTNTVAAALRALGALCNQPAQNTAPPAAPRSDINSASKPRGIVDLSTVTDVSDGGAATGRPNSIKVSTAGGHIAYLCDSETAQVRAAARAVHQHELGLCSSVAVQLRAAYRRAGGQAGWLAARVAT